MSFKMPQKRTDNPCTCRPYMTHPTENPADAVVHHEPTCLSLYPKQPAPGDAPTKREPSAKDPIAELSAILFESDNVAWINADGLKRAKDLVAHLRGDAS
jgi:hypothetical protein